MHVWPLKAPVHPSLISQRSKLRGNKQKECKENPGSERSKKERIPLYAMVFSSVPTHLDPPNWNQQLHHGQLPSVVVDALHQLPPVRPLMAPPLAMAAATSGSGGAPGGSSVRPASMEERARMAKMPQLEPGLKCPRCDSTNTKFCYFNNYSLSQPRHFCKTCRRYWTRGGALRDVPVGGGCRRNKRNKSSKKHSSSSSSSGTASASATSSTSSSTAVATAAKVLPPLLQPSFGSLHSLGRDRYSTIGASRLGFPGLSSSLHPAFDYLQLGGGLGLELDRWRLPPTQQFPFLTSADAAPPLPPDPSLMSSGSYQFDDAAEAGNAEAASLAGQMLASASMAGSGGLITQMASVKMDDNPPSAAMSSPREFLGLGGNLQFWGSGEGDNGGGGGVLD